MPFLPKVNVTVPNFEQYGLRQRKLVQVKLMEASEQAGKEAVDIMRHFLKVLDVDATGKLSESVQFVSLTTNMLSVTASMKGQLEFTSPYAMYANDGRSGGGFPPFEAIKTWVMNKKSFKGEKTDANIAKIRYIIGQTGTNGKHFIETARPFITRNNRRVLQNKLKELNNASN